MSAIGVLINMVQRHEANWVSTPPSTRPSAAPLPAIAP